MVLPDLARSPNLAELSWVRSPSEKEMETEQSEAPSPAHPQGGQASRPLPGPQCEARLRRRGCPPRLLRDSRRGGWPRRTTTTSRSQCPYCSLRDLLLYFQVLSLL